MTDRPQLTVHQEPGDRWRRPRAQWSIRTLVAFATVAALALSGFQQWGIEGVFGTLFLTYLAVIGVLTIVHSKRSFLGALLGGGILAIAVVGWLAMQSAQRQPIGSGMEDLYYNLTSEETWTSLALLALFLFGYLWLIRPKWTVKIIVDRHGRARFAGIPEVKKSTVSEFLEKCLSTGGPFKIYAHRGPNGHLRTEMRGISEVADRQRVRNFMDAIL